MRRLVRRLHPAVTVWYHQHMRLVNLSRRRRPRASCAPTPAASACPRAGCRTTTAPPPAGRTTRSPARARSWSSCPPARSAPPSARRHAQRRPGGRSPTAAAVAATRPHIVWRRIPFGANRRAQTRAYAKRHYGTSTDRLRPEGDRRALHGLVDVLLGLQHVRLQRARRRAARAARRVLALHRRQGRHDLPARVAEADLPPHGRAQRPRDRHRARRQLRRRDPRPPRAAARLAARSRAGCSRATASGRSDVIGHAESLSSPYHHERVARLRTQTHGDFDPRRRCAATGRSYEPRDRPRPPRRDRVEPLRAAHRHHRPAAAARGRGAGARGRAEARRARVRARAQLADAARPPHRRAGRLRRPRRARRRPEGARLRRVRGADHEGDPRRAPGLGRVARRLPRRRDARRSSPRAPTA